MDNCPICHNFMYAHKQHRCPYKWKVLISFQEGWSELADPSWVSEYTIFASTAQMAAEEAIAEDERSDVDYSVAEDKATAHVKVTLQNGPPHPEPPIQYFSITGYISPEYEATRTYPTDKQLTPPENTPND